VTSKRVSHSQIQLISLLTEFCFLFSFFHLDQCHNASYFADSEDTTEKSVSSLLLLLSENDTQQLDMI
jgi:hypothetical protein